jgi:hypothetical protein
MSSAPKPAALSLASGAGAGRLRGVDLDHLSVNLAEGGPAGIVGGFCRCEQGQGK